MADNEAPNDEMELAEALADLYGDDPEHLEECPVCSADTEQVAQELVDHFATDDELN